MHKDIRDVGDGISTSNADWNFSGDVCETFDKHISKSVPLYNDGQNLIAKFSDYFIKEGSVCYDIGCSTGEIFSKIIDRTNKKSVKYIGIDPVLEMIELARSKYLDNPNVEFVVDSIENIEIEPSDLIVSYYTMQFISPKYRQIIINKIYKSLNWGGAFFIFEKVRAPDARFQDIFTETYADYKLDQGYDPLEIFMKTRSLKGVLEPFSSQGNVDLIKRAGFVDYVTVMKYINFEGVMCIK